MKKLNKNSIKNQKNEEKSLKIIFKTLKNNLICGN